MALTNTYSANEKMAAVDLLIEMGYRFTMLSRKPDGTLIGYWWQSDGEKPYPRQNEFYLDALIAIEHFEPEITPEQIRRRACENIWTTSTQARQDEQLESMVA